MTAAILIERTGGPEVMALKEVSVPPPLCHEARVRHTAIGVNFIDTYHRSGLYPLPSLPHGIGMEAAGVVEALGDAVEGLQVGDRVAYACPPAGAYCQARCLAADRLVRLPDDISDEQAAAVMLKGMTVEYLIRRASKAEPGMTVVWHAAAGGVGLLACQWLHHLGVRVIGTAGGREKCDLARRHGCAEVIDYSRQDIAERVRQLTDGQGVPIVYDGVGRATLSASLDCLQPRGMLVSFGNASGAAEPLDILELSRRGSLFLTRPRLMDYTADPKELQDSAQALFEMVRRGALEVAIHQRWPLGEAALAHHALQSRQTTGSTILCP
jgi:NADPH2:quinone reductase